MSYWSYGWCWWRFFSRRHCRKRNVLLCLNLQKNLVLWTLERAHLSGIYNGIAYQIDFSSSIWLIHSQQIDLPYLVEKVRDSKPMENGKTIQLSLNISLLEKIYPKQKQATTGECSNEYQFAPTLNSTHTAKSYYCAEICKLNNKIKKAKWQPVNISNSKKNCFIRGGREKTRENRFQV